MERTLLYLALMASIAMALSSALLLHKPHVYTAECSDVWALARDVRIAYTTRSIVYNTYNLKHPVAVTPTSLSCHPCLVELSIPTQNSTVLIGRQRLVIDASNGIVKLYKLKF